MSKGMHALSSKMSWNGNLDDLDERQVELGDETGWIYVGECGQSGGSAQLATHPTNMRWIARSTS